jgi:hypothetical protein
MSTHDARNAPTTLVAHRTTNAAGRRITTADVLRFACVATLGVLLSAELAQLARRAVAERRLHEAAQAAAGEAILPRATQTSVRESALRRVRGSSIARAVETIDVTIDRRAARGRFAPRRGQVVRVDIRAAPPATWSLLARWGVLEDDPPLSASSALRAP